MQMNAGRAASPRTLAIFHDGLAWPRLERWAARRRSLPARVAAKAGEFLRMRRNPRDLRYMADLLPESVPGAGPGEILAVGPEGRLPGVSWDRFDRIVLLWPDANGTGWRRIENAVLSRCRQGAEVLVLNGRRRLFPATRRSLWPWRARRAIEKTLVPELAFTGLFLVATPLLLAWDLLRGRW